MSTVEPVTSSKNLQPRGPVCAAAAHRPVQEHKVSTAGAGKTDTKRVDRSLGTQNTPTGEIHSYSLKCTDTGPAQGSAGKWTVDPVVRRAGFPFASCGFLNL